MRVGGLSKSRIKGLGIWEHEDWVKESRRVGELNMDKRRVGELSIREKEDWI